MNELLLQWLGGETDLVFGDATLVIIGAELNADAVPAVPAITGIVTSTNSIDLIDADGVTITARAQTATATATPLLSHDTATNKTASPAMALHTEADLLAGGRTVTHGQMGRASRKVAERAQQGIHVDGKAAVRNADCERIKLSLAELAQQAISTETHATTQHTDTNKTMHTIGQKHATALPTITGLRLDHNFGRLVDVSISIDWQQAIPPPAGYWQGSLPVDPPIPDPQGDFVNLLFSKQNSVNLLFGDLTTGTALADREAYIVANTFEMKRASDNALIECRDFNASIDVDSWSWSWSASIAASQQALISPVNGDPVEVIVTVNGFVLRLVCERMSRARKFPDTWLSIGGRGRSTWLAAPYDFARTYDNAGGSLTANQLADEALKENGVSIGWAVDWQIEDWTVPAGAWRFQGTYIDAVNRIAEAGGAYVQADHAAKTLHILPRYPAMPVDLSGLDQDVELPEDICETESVEWIDKADYNAVWIAGGAAGGRLDKVVKEQTAGDKPAATVTDDLMTATQATRQRGLRILADTGRQAMVTLRLPVLDEVGVVMVGDIVDYTEQGSPRRGINRATSLQYSYPQLWQTIRIETHG